MTTTTIETVWTYEGYWNVVVGRSASQCVLEFDLGSDRKQIAAWLDEAAIQAWQAGGIGGRMPQSWLDYFDRALDALHDAAQDAAKAQS